MNSERGWRCDSVVETPDDDCPLAFRGTGSSTCLYPRLHENLQEAKGLQQEYETTFRRQDVHILDLVITSYMVILSLLGTLKAVISHQRPMLCCCGR